MNLLLFILSLVGLLVTLFGWLFDRALDISWVARLIAPAYFHAKAVLNQLEGNSRLAITADERGCVELLKRWPGLADITSVGMISRSIAFMSFGPTVTPEIELIARRADKSEILPRWRMAAARHDLEHEAKTRVFRVGAIVFSIGLAISLLAAVLQFREASRAVSPELSLHAV